MLISVDVDGRCLLCNLPQRVVLARFNFKAKVRAAATPPQLPRAGSRTLSPMHGGACARPPNCRAAGCAVALARWREEALS
jgi:hypothetical protein